MAQCDRLKVALWRWFEFRMKSAIHVAILDHEVLPDILLERNIGVISLVTTAWLPATQKGRV